jgi:lipopolysaccharide export system protein LptA
MDARSTVLVSAACALIGVAGMVMAQGEEPATNSTVITSKHLDFDYPKHTAVFKGDVVVVDPRVRIEADTITTVFSTNNQPETITAEGNVRIVQTDRVATSARAVYSVNSGLMVMTGKPRITRGGDVLEGTRIVFNRDEDNVKCDDAVLKIAPGADAGLGDLIKK